MDIIVIRTWLGRQTWREMECNVVLRNCRVWWVRMQGYLAREGFLEAWRVGTDI